MREPEEATESIAATVGHEVLEGAILAAVEVTAQRGCTAGHQRIERLPMMWGQAAGRHTGRRGTQHLGEGQAWRGARGPGSRRLPRAGAGVHGLGSLRRAGWIQRAGQAAQAFAGYRDVVGRGDKIAVTQQLFERDQIAALF